MSGSWSPLVVELEPSRNAGALTDVRALLVRLVDAYDQATVAGLLGVDKSSVSNWVRGRRAMSAAFRMRVLEVHDVLTRAHEVFNPTLAARWLVGHEPLLGGARPLDVIGLRGAAPVIEALDAIASGGFA